MGKKPARIIDVLITGGLFVLALVVRLNKLEVITPGMWGDEITVGKMAEQLWSMNRLTPFINVNYGHSTPLLYLTGLVINFWGRSMISIRLVSVVFGALSVGLLYVLLRLFFKPIIAGVATTMMLFSYAHIIISRFGYEMTAAMFFQILTVICLYLAYRTKKYPYYLAVGIGIGLGLFTYLGFRTIATALVVLSLFSLKQLPLWKQRLTSLGLIIVPMLIIISPLINYGIKHPGQLWKRARAISVFHQDLPRNEVIKELTGSTKRTLGMFWTTGDPNPRQNPAFTTMFDKLTVIIVFLGLVTLFKKNKRFLAASLLLAVIALMNDIFAIERIPEGHYYGLGHPNTLRVFAIIPIVYFWSAWGLKGIKAFCSKFDKQLYVLMFSIMAIIIISINWSWYFDQPISDFNYLVNGADKIKLVRLINQSQEKIVFASPSIIRDARVEYLVKKNIRLEPFILKEGEFSSDDLPQGGLILIDVKENPDYAQSLIDRSQELAPELMVMVEKDPWQRIEALVIKRN